ncbi:MAG: FliI/YscN family ATPase [Deltaproteobacteria bacterium]|nr:FliI/YscN family ATPase [Deltaproteobacteria bacterium]
MSDGGLEDALARLQGASTVRMRGRVTALTGLVMRAIVPGVRVGDHVQVLRRTEGPMGAEVVGFAGEEAILMPLGEAIGIGPDSLVESGGLKSSILCGESLLGRVIDGLGQPMDGGGPLEHVERWALRRPAPDPLSRPRITRPLELGVRAIDGLLTVGEGQRVGLFSGSGVGKSTLLGQIARHADVDVCVVCLVGERGREVREFMEDALGEGLSRSVVVCATSDAPPLVRLKSAQVATAVAEYFRDAGRRVLLLMDSVTRYARALREVGLASGEAPARRGYPPSVFAALPRLLERTGNSEAGSITALYTVLVEGGDMEEPVADEVRGILDGHIVLSRELGQRGHFPAIDVLQSISRVMTQIVSPEQQKEAMELRGLLATYERQRDLIVLGAYQQGSDATTDRAIAKIGAIEAFLRQTPDEHVTLEETRSAMSALL